LIQTTYASPVAVESVPATTGLVPRTANTAGCQAIPGGHSVCGDAAAAAAGSRRSPTITASRFMPENVAAPDETPMNTG